jgi:hypothetical protein
MDQQASEEIQEYLSHSCYDYSRDWYWRELFVFSNQSADGGDMSADQASASPGRHETHMIKVKAAPLFLC